MDEIDILVDNILEPLPDEPEKPPERLVVLPKPAEDLPPVHTRKEPSEVDLGRVEPYARYRLGLAISVQDISFFRGSTSTAELNRFAREAISYYVGRNITSEDNITVDVYLDPLTDSVHIIARSEESENWFEQYPEGAEIRLKRPTVAERQEIMANYNAPYMLSGRQPRYLTHSTGKMVKRL